VNICYVKSLRATQRFLCAIPPDILLVPIFFTAGPRKEIYALDVMNGLNSPGSTSGRSIRFRALSAFTKLDGRVKRQRSWGCRRSDEKGALLSILNTIKSGCYVPQTAVVDGDALSASIAAESIVAKETRDSIMQEYAQIYPGYGFDRHRGYGTADHMVVLKRPLPCHRWSFAPVWRAGRVQPQLTLWAISGKEGTNGKWSSAR
jgi:hypothetical protein